MLSLELNLNLLDKDILDWYNNSSVDDISNALYHGYKIVSNPLFNKRIEVEENYDNKLELLQDEIQHYKQKMRDIRDEVKLEMMELNGKLLEEKNLRLEEYKERVGDLVSSKTLLNEKCIELETKYTDLENIMSNSYKKGAFAESKLEDVLDEKLGGEYLVDNIGKRDNHSADIHISNRCEDGIILVESKFYSEGSKNMVSHKEIPKFHKDIDSCKAKCEVYSAIFISYGCDIPNITRSFTVRQEKGMRVYYFANMTEELLEMMINIIKMETICYKDQNIKENADEMNRFLTKYFKEISTNYAKIEELDPGYEEIIKKISTVEKKYNKKRKSILDSVKTVSDNFMKLQEIEDGSDLSIGINSLLSIKTPHHLNMTQWENFVNELVRLRVSNTGLKSVDNLDDQDNDE